MRRLLPAAWDTVGMAALALLIVAAAALLIPLAGVTLALLLAPVIGLAACALLSLLLVRITDWMDGGQR